jgi:hypothetical protein
MIEMLIVLFIAVSVLGLATSLLVRANRSFRDSTRAADAHVEMGLATGRMAADIRASSDAAAEGGALVLAGPDGSRTVWRLKERRLVRSGPGGERTWRAGIMSMEVTAEKARSGVPFVEVAYQAERGGDARGRVFYVGASPRVAEAQ